MDLNGIGFKRNEKHSSCQCSKDMNKKINSDVNFNEFNSCLMLEETMEERVGLALLIKRGDRQF
jgi:hypothetical protein